MNESVRLPDEAATRALGAALAKRVTIGDVVFLSGELGAGKTTLVRGFLEALGSEEPVRSPTFNIVQTFETSPPVAHVDLYRVNSHVGLGLEDFLETHVTLIEWPEPSAGLIDESKAWKVAIEFAGESRMATVTPPEP